MIGDKIKRVRLEMGMTLKALAASAEIHLGYLSNIEANKRMPSIPVLMSIAEALETPVTNLLPSKKGGPHENTQCTADGITERRPD